MAGAVNQREEGKGPCPVPQPGMVLCASPTTQTKRACTVRLAQSSSSRSAAPTSPHAPSAHSACMGGRGGGGGGCAERTGKAEVQQVCHGGAWSKRRRE